MSEPTWPTVAEAVILTGRSKSVIYEVIASGQARSQDSTDGTLVNLASLRVALASRRRGRPGGSSKHS